MSESGQAGNPAPGERLVYVLPAASDGATGSGQVDLLELWDTLWNAKWQVIAITAAFTLVALAYALFATEWYESDVLLSPAEQIATPGSGSDLGDLVSLTALGITPETSVEPVAVLGSREFARSFIEDLDLLNVLFAEDWDAKAQRWSAEDEEDWPDIRDAVQYFEDDLRRVDVDPETGLVTLTIRWTDPDAAANWANTLVRRLNEKMRRRTLEEAQQNFDYLREELGSTNLVSLQQTIGRLMETELQRLMLARGSPEFSFRVIDPAVAAKQPAWPNRIVVLLGGIILGGTVALIWVFGRAAVRHPDA
jgi:uncharacterized protein involved in exopolysaccharide biosynthesis